MESIKELRKICQNPAEYHNPESVWDNRIWRPFSIYLTKLLLYTPLKPDHVTMILIFWGFLTGFFFSFGTYWLMLVGAMIFEFSNLLDAVDGEMARYKKISSLNGVFLDRIAHLTNIAAPFMGLTIGLYKSNPSICIVLAGLSASIFSILCLSIQTFKYHVIIEQLIEGKKRIEQINLKKVNQKLNLTKKSTLKSIGKLINYLPHQSYLMQIFLLGAIFNKFYWVLLLYSIVLPLIWLAKLIYEYKTGYSAYEYLLDPYRKKK